MAIKCYKRTCTTINILNFRTTPLHKISLFVSAMPFITVFFLVSHELLHYLANIQKTARAKQ